jgi:hypothetical protein
MWITCFISFSLVWLEISQNILLLALVTKASLANSDCQQVHRSLLLAYLSHMMKNWTNGRTYRALLPFILESEDVQSLWWEGVRTQDEISSPDRGSMASAFCSSWRWICQLTRITIGTYYTKLFIYLPLSFCDEMLFICIHTVWLPRCLRALLEDMNKLTPSDGKSYQHNRLIQHATNQW